MAVSSDTIVDLGADTKQQHCDLINLLLFLVHFPKFENIKGGLGNHFAVCVCVGGGRLVEQEEIAVAKQWQHEHIPASINMLATIKTVGCGVFYLLLNFF
jgi:hypothetical protein